MTQASEARWRPVASALFASRGRILDVLILAAGVLVTGPLARLLGSLAQGFAGNDDVAAHRLGWLLLAVFGAYVGGLLVQPRRRRGPGELSGFILFWLLVLFFCLCIIGSTMASVGLGIPDPWGFPVAILLAAAPPAAVIWRWARQPARGHELLAAPRELAGDVLMMGAVLVCSTVWSAGVVHIFEGVGGPLSMRISAAVFALVAWVFFYLSPRVAYLLEDGRDRSTWLMIGFAATPVAFRVLTS